MSVLAPWALLGLLLTVPLVLLHLRHRRPPAVTVPSLLLAGERSEARQARSRRWGRPPLPLLLALQVLAVVLLVLALAEPSSGPPAPAGARVAFVVDGSVWMRARTGDTATSGDRMPAARRALGARLAALDAGTPVAVVLAGPVPRVLFRGDAGDAAGAVARRLVAGTAPSTLPAAVALAADVRRGPDARVVVLRAPENAAPAVRAPAGGYVATAIGRPVRDHGIGGAHARCGLPAADDCEVLATVTQTSGPATTVKVAVRSGGRDATSTTADLAAGASSAPVVLRAPPGARLRLSLPAGDALADDDRTFVAVPAATTPSVTIVAAADRAGILERAFSAVPGVRAHTVLPARYRTADARDADLLVLDAFSPAGRAFPGARAVLYVDPPRLPAGRIAGTLANGTPSGSAPEDPLLSGVDLDALTPDPGTARRVRAPAWLAPVAWSPSGPLLLAGDDGRRRVAVLALDPAASPLPQSEAFPLLAANLVRWAQEWIPAQTEPGAPVLAQVPAATRSTALGADATRDAPAVLVAAGAGTPAARQAGSWGVRERAVSSSVDAAPGAGGAGTLVDLRVDPVAPEADRATADLSPWLLLAAFLVLLAEWLYALRMRPGRRARA